MQGKGNQSSPFMPCNCNFCQRLDGWLGSRREARWTSAGALPGTGLLRPVTIEAASRGDETTPRFYRAGVSTTRLDSSIEGLRDAEFAGTLPRNFGQCWKSVGVLFGWEG
jgi:hypothetical protein